MHKEFFERSRIRSICQVRSVEKAGELGALHRGVDLRGAHTQFDREFGVGGAPGVRCHDLQSYVDILRLQRHDFILYSRIANTECNGLHAFFLDHLLDKLLDPKTPTARKTRTLYVREEDQEIWDQAKELVGDSLSTYITNHLKTLVASEKAAQQGFERIVLKFTRDKIPQAKAFYGRWIIPLQNPLSAVYEGTPDYYSVALTAKNKIVIFNFLGEEYRDNAYIPALMHVFDSLEAASKMPDLPENLVSEVMKRQGIEIQELDI